MKPQNALNQTYNFVKRTPLFLPFLLCIACLSLSAPFSGHAGDFNAVGLVLGESLEKATARFAEKSIRQASRKESVLVYASPLVKINGGAETELEFHQDKLMRVRVYFSLPNDRFQEFKSHYDPLKGMLEGKYGRPVVRRELISASFNGNLSASMLEGEIGYGSLFVSGDVEIRLVLQNKDERTYRYFLEYVDTGIRKQKEEENNSTLMDVL